MIGGFSFKGVDASTVGVVVAGSKRVVKPGVEEHEYKIPGKDGTIFYGKREYEKFSIEVPVVLKRTDTKTIRQISRELGYFLQGSGSLIFADEPDKEYIASVPDSTEIAETLVFGKATIKFSCQPFARSVEYNQIASYEVPLTHTDTVTVSGTQETPCIINITAKSDIKDITINYTKEV